MNIIPTHIHKEAVRPLQLDKRPAWGCLFVEDATGKCIGARLTWLDGPASCPDEHFTDDDGQTYRRMSGELFPLDWSVSSIQLGEIETDHSKLSSLRRLMEVYRDSLKGTTSHAF